MSKRVIKIGGSNLKSKDDLSKIIEVVQAYNEPLVIVVSAWYGLTDRLKATIAKAADDRAVIQELSDYLTNLKRDIIHHYIDLPKERERAVNQIKVRIDELEKYLKGVHYLGEAPDFTEDMVMSFGERLSASLIVSVLSAAGIACEKVTPEEMGLITDGRFGNARIDFDKALPLVKKRLDNDLTNIVPGFYGVSREDGRVTLLGRGGSDYTAAAIARCIDAPSLDTWKDVSGFLSADPRIVAQPRLLKHLTYREAAELSYFGAKILHPMTVEPLVGNNIPVRIFSINEIDGVNEAPSIIQNDIEEEGRLKSVTYTHDVALLKMSGPGIGINPGIINKITLAFNNADINIKSIFTSQTSINFMLAKENLQQSEQLVASLGLPSIQQITNVDDISLIALVGEGVADSPQITNQVLHAFVSRNIGLRLVSIGASSAAAYFIVETNACTKAVQAIHDDILASEGLSNGSANAGAVLQMA
ncbi:aspartate kinase [candidate division KSB1 bacterium]|nr:aspartate kinase [candidate division KSB1 bacterium]